VTSFPAEKLPSRRVASQAMFVRVPFLAGSAQQPPPQWAPAGWSAGSARLALRGALMAANALAVAATLARQPRPRRGGLLCLLPGAAERDGGGDAALLAADFAGELRALAWPDAPFALGGFAELAALQDGAGGADLPGAVLLLALAPLPGAAGGTASDAVVDAMDALRSARVPFVLCTLFCDTPAAAQPAAPPARMGAEPRAVAEADTRAMLARLRPLLPQLPPGTPSPAEALLAAVAATPYDAAALDAAVAAAEAALASRPSGGGGALEDGLVRARARRDAAVVEAALKAALAGEDAKTDAALPGLRAALKQARALADAAPPLARSVAAELNALAQRAAGRVEALRSVAAARVALAAAVAPQAAAPTAGATPAQAAALADALAGAAACAWPWQLAPDVAAAEAVAKRWRLLAALADAAAGADPVALSARLRAVAAAHPDADVAYAERRLAELEAEAAAGRGDTRLCAYRDACATAWADGAVSAEGAAFLAGLRRSLRITPVEHETALRLSGASAAMAAAAGVPRAAPQDEAAAATRAAAESAADELQGRALLSTLPAPSTEGSEAEAEEGEAVAFDDVGSMGPGGSDDPPEPGTWRHVGAGVCYNEDAVLGVGSRGTYVFRGWVRRTSRARHPAAVKRVVRPPGPAGRALVELVEREVELLAALNTCPRVQHFHAWALTDAHVFIATELCPESLAQHVARQPRLSLADRLRLMRQAAEGVAWLHAASVAHNDLKPANLLVAADGSLKLADVGLGVRLREALGGAGEEQYSLSTFRQYGVELNLSGRAPEVLAGQRGLTAAVDVWHLACVFFFVLTGADSPFALAGRSADEADAAIRTGRFELSALMALRGPRRAALEARHLLAAMLSPLPSERPSAADVLRHPLFWSADAALQAAKALHDGGGDPDGALLTAAMRGGGPGSGSASERSALLAAACCDLAGWQSRVDGALASRMVAYAGPAGRYDDSFAGLLRFARNAHEHPPAGAELAPLVRTLQEAGANAQAARRDRTVAARRRLLADYLLALFPSLAIACFEVMTDAQLNAVLAVGNDATEVVKPVEVEVKAKQPRRKAASKGQQQREQPSSR